MTVSLIPETEECVKNRWAGLTDFEKQNHRQKMEEWAEKHPFAAMMILGEQSEEEKLKLAEERFCK